LIAWLIAWLIAAILSYRRPICGRLGSSVADSGFSSPIRVDFFFSPLITAAIPQFFVEVRLLRYVAVEVRRRGTRRLSDRLAVTPR